METKFIKKLGFLFLLIAAFIINSGMAQSFDKRDDIKAVIKKERERIKRSKLKSETLWLYRAISGGTEENGVKVFFRKFDQNGNTLEETSFKQDGGLLKKLTHTYNSIGNATESFSSKPGGIGNTKTIFNYDSDNNLVETITYNSGGSVVMSMEYKYDNGGNMIKMITATPDRSVYSKFSFKRNSDGNIIETNADRSISGKGITSSKIIFTYTSDGYKREQISYDSDSRISQKTDYRYDSDGNLIEQSHKNSDGIVTSRRTNKYDANENNIETILSIPSANMEKKLIFKYDTNGNKVEQLRYNKLNQPVSVAKYVYEYYK